MPRLIEPREANPAHDHMRELIARGEPISTSDFTRHIDRFGFGFLTPEALNVLSRTSPQEILSVGTGLGYAEAQLEAYEFSITGFDKTIHLNRWLHDTRNLSDAHDYNQWREHALFMSFPDRTPTGASFSASIVRDFCEAGGSKVIIITEKREHRHLFGSDRELYETLASLSLLDTVALPAWPQLDLLSMPFAGNGYTTFEPEMRVYEVVGK